MVPMSDGSLSTGSYVSARNDGDFRRVASGEPPDLCGLREGRLAGDQVDAAEVRALLAAT
jgi:hypothetical protein